MHNIVYYFAVLLTCRWFGPRSVKVNVKRDPMLACYTSSCLENDPNSFLLFFLGRCCLVYSVSALMSFVRSLHQRLVIYFIFHRANIPFYITLLFSDFLCIFGGNGRSVCLRELSYVDCLLCFQNLLSCMTASPRERRK